jgi:diaminopimelate decarboxylase
MNLFEYRGGRLWCEQQQVADLAARFDTPLYVYSAGTLQAHYERFRAAFAALDPLICYSIKCCSNVHILRRLAGWGSGFDVVSGGELCRALQAGAGPAKFVFAGVGKTVAEMQAALRAGVGLLNVESESEMAELVAVAGALGLTADVAVRLNPDVDAKTHPYTTTGTQENKFGVGPEQARELFHAYRATPAVRLRGLHLHIGSPVHDVQPYVAAIERALDLIATLRCDGSDVDTLDIGGGFGAHYRGGEAPPAEAYAAALVPLLHGRGLRVILEPGRSIAANAGLLVTRVLHVKDSGRRRFAIVDASMNELIRPALYSAYHFVWPLDAGARIPADFRGDQPFAGLETYDVVGPICESSDFLAKDRPLPPVRRGDLLAVFTCGAYAMSMASQYNSRPRAAEVLVEGDVVQLIRRRETYVDLLRAEEVG